MADEIIRELWQIKDDIASKHNYDLKKLVKYLQQKERNEKHGRVDLQAMKNATETVAVSALQGSAPLHTANP